MIFTGSGTPSVNRLIKGNIITNAIGAADGTSDSTSNSGQGIYLDDNTANTLIEDNYVENANYGMFLHNTTRNTVRNNIFHNNRTRAIFIYHNVPAGHYGNSNMVITNNVFSTTDPNKILVDFDSDATT